MTPAACLEIAHERLRETRLLLDNQEHKANDSFNTATVLVGAQECHTMR